MAYLSVLALLLRTHEPLQSIYSEFKGLLARRVAGRTSFAAHAIRDLIVTSTNGLKFRIPFSLDDDDNIIYTQTSGFVADAFAAPAAAGSSAIGSRVHIIIIIT